MGRWKPILQVAATYVGTVVGAGFASGQEILQFFTRYGNAGAFAVLISTWLFIWLGGKIMETARRLDCHSYQELNLHLFGNRLGWVVNGFILMILLGTTGVMLSGTGAIFAEQYGLPHQFGIIAAMVLCWFTLYRGMHGVIWVNSLVVPAMLLFVLFLGILLVDRGPDGAFPSHAVSPKAFSSPFLYAAYNLALAQAVLVPLGKEMGDRSIVRWGGMLGGIGLGLLLLVSHFTLLFHYPSIEQLDIPMAGVIAGMGKPVALLFSLLILGEIFTTVTGNVFGLVRQAESLFRLKPPLSTLMILLVSFLISQWGFRSLVSFLYPLFGVIGLVFLVRIASFRPQKLP